MADRHRHHRRAGRDLRSRRWYGQQWGAPQWGPLAEWIAGAATFGAVVVALREAARGQRAREIDHEISRRRECIAALGDLWGALVGLIIDFRTFVNDLDDLRPHFNVGAIWQPIPEDGRVKTVGDVLLTRIQEFWDRWAKTVEPPLFTARLVLRGTPLSGPIEQVNLDINTIKTDGLKSITTPIKQGRRPDTAQLTKMWHDLLSQRDEHAKLGREHLSLDRNDVERYLRQNWKR